MNDQEQYGRENQKMRLRQQVVEQTPEAAQEEIAEKIRQHRKKQRRIVLALVIAAACAFGIYRLADYYHVYHSSGEEWSVASGSGTVAVLGNSVLQYGHDGVTCYRASGTAAWNSGYSMQTPSLEINGTYGLISDRESNSAVIFSESGGLQGTISTTESIIDATVSAHGVAALLLDDGDAGIIQFYNKDGSKLDISIRTALSGDGFPLEIALSPAGTTLMASMVYLENGSLQNRVVFFNFETGKTSSDRIVGYFKYDSSLFARIGFLSDTEACAVADDQICFYSIKDESSPQAVSSVKCGSEIKSVSLGSGRIGVLMEGTNQNNQFCLYDKTGKLLLNQSVSADYTRASVSQGYVIFHNDLECLVMTESGRTKFQTTLSEPVTGLYFLSKLNYVTSGTQGLKGMKLK